MGAPVVGSERRQTPAFCREGAPGCEHSQSPPRRNRLTLRSFPHHRGETQRRHAHSARQRLLGGRRPRVCHDHSQRCGVCARTPRQITRPRDALCLLYGRGRHGDSQHQHASAPYQGQGFRAQPGEVRRDHGSHHQSEVPFARRRRARHPRFAGRKRQPRRSFRRRLRKFRNQHLGLSRRTAHGRAENHCYGRKHGLYRHGRAT